MSKNRAIVFIDGNNFYYKLKEIIKQKEGILKLLDFDYLRFVQRLIKEDIAVEIRYYVGVVKRQNGINKDKSEELYANQQKLFARLHQHGLITIFGNLIQHPDKSYHEKGVDVRIAVEMIRLARENKYDTAYLLSSDTDLVPAVEEVRSLNKSVVYVGISKGQSFGLTKVANNTLLLRDDDVMPFIPQLHQMKLKQSNFDKMKSGIKTIETRLFDEKRKLVKIGDEIEFTSTEDKSIKMYVKVTDLHRFSTFDELFRSKPIESFGYSTYEDTKSIYKYYSKEDESRYGVVGIGLMYLK